MNVFKVYNKYVIHVLITHGILKVHSHVHTGKKPHECIKSM